jgi:hypothetical protein
LRHRFRLLLSPGAHVIQLDHEIRQQEDRSARELHPSHRLALTVDEIEPTLVYFGSSPLRRVIGQFPGWGEPQLDETDFAGFDLSRTPRYTGHCDMEGASLIRTTSEVQVFLAQCRTRVFEDAINQVS